MNKYHQTLNLPATLVVNENIIAFMAPLLHRYCLKFNPDEHNHYKLPVDAIPGNFVEWFNSAFPDLFIKDWEIFYTPPKNILPIHSDGYQPFIDFTKLNFVYNGGSSVMQWFKLKEEVPLDSDTNKNNTSYTFIKPEQVDCVHEAQIGTPSLVNVGVPHGIDNSDNNAGRWCICLIPNFKDSKKRSTPRVLFNEALDLFKGYIQ